MESVKEYPVSINGKLRTTMVLSLDATQQQVEELVLTNDTVLKWLEGSRRKKKDHLCKNKMINIVV